MSSQQKSQKGMSKWAINISPHLPVVRAMKSTVTRKYFIKPYWHKLKREIVSIWLRYGKNDFS